MGEWEGLVEGGRVEGGGGHSCVGECEEAGGRRQEAVPVPVVLQGVEDVLGVGVDQVSPRLPQGVHDVVYETHLQGM